MQPRLLPPLRQSPGKFSEELRQFLQKIWLKKLQFFPDPRTQIHLHELRVRYEEDKDYAMTSLEPFESCLKPIPSVRGFTTEERYLVDFHTLRSPPTNPL